MIRRFSRLALYSLSLLSCFSASTFATEDQLSSSAEKLDANELPLPLRELRTFADVFNHIRSSYVEEVDDKTLLEYAIKGMLEGLDPHSNYLDADAFESLQVNTSGEFGGLGMEVGMENGFVKVVTPMDGTPADKAGIEPGDLIIKLDEKPVKGLSLNEAVDLMRGPKGSKIILTLVREGIAKPFELTLTRDIIKVLSTRSKELEPGYHYIRISQFQNATGEEFADIIRQAASAATPLRGIILDLRNNPGGVLQSSVKVVDSVLKEGLIVYTEGRIEESKSSYTATGNDLSNNTPIVVLINGGSASASEIVAGALQDQRRAIIMGTKSFGKGSVQNVVQISKNSGIKLTTARYYTPNGRSIQALGIEPDIIVERAKIETLPQGKGVSEADLKGHLKGNNKQTENSKLQTQRELYNSDNQLYEAINLLKGLNILNRQPEVTVNNDATNP